MIPITRTMVVRMVAGGSRHEMVGLAAGLHDLGVLPDVAAAGASVGTGRASKGIGPCRNATLFKDLALSRATRHGMPWRPRRAKRGESQPERPASATSG
jgi:hypothetical protein